MVVGVDGHAEQRVDHRQAVGAGVDARDRAIVDDVGHVGRELGQHRHRRRGVPADAGPPPPRRRVAGEDQAAVLDVRAGDVDLDRRQAAVRRAAGGPARRTPRRCCPRSRRRRGRRCSCSQGRSCSRKPSMPGPCSPIELSMPLGGLRHPRRRPPGARLEHDRLGDHGAEVGDVEELVELAAGGGAAGRGEHRVGQQRARRAGWSGRRSGSVRPARGASTVRIQVISVASRRRVRRRHRRARSQVVPAHPVAGEDRPVDAGPDHPGRPSSPTTGSTQVMQTPMPQAIDSSTAHWRDAVRAARPR